MSIDLNPSAEQRQIVDAVRGMLADNWPVARLREAATAAPSNAALIEALAGLGVFGMGLAEADGGAGFSVLEEVLVHVELGRFLVTPSALATGLAARLAHENGLADHFAAMTAGSARVCLANPLGPFSPAGPAGAEFLLIDAEGCALALAWWGEAVALLDIRALRLTPGKAADPRVTIGRARVAAEAVIASAGQGSLVAATAGLLVSAQLLGAAEATRDMAAAYAKIRTQFGAPIGSFQAVKHRCADMAIRAEVLQAQLMFAAIAERDGWADAGFQNEACRLLASRYALDNAVGNVQVHGAIGFSAEADAHLYVHRAHLLENIGGRPHDIERRFSQRVAPLALA